MVVVVVMMMIHDKDDTQNNKQKHIPLKHNGMGYCFPTNLITN